MECKLKIVDRTKKAIALKWKHCASVTLYRLYKNASSEAYCVVLSWGLRTNKYCRYPIQFLYYLYIYMCVYVIGFITNNNLKAFPVCIVLDQRLRNYGPIDNWTFWTVVYWRYILMFDKCRFNASISITGSYSISVDMI